jgi:cytochrome c peroxidase
MKTALWVALLVAAAVLSRSATAQDGAYRWNLPPGVAPPPVPSDNPMSAAKVALGRRLFYDADLSIDGTTACATCHEQHRAFTEGNATHAGVRGAQGRRNPMGLANVAYLSPLTWADPSLTTLERQVLVPIVGEHPVEMGMAGQEGILADRLAADACYRRMFAAAFPREPEKVSLETIAKAIATFERTLLSFDSPYDRFRRGDRNAISLAAQRGEALFSDRQCASCHSGGSFTDMEFHRIGPVDRLDNDRGLSEKTNDSLDDGKFRTPSLRNVSLTGPYLHDGSAKDMAAAIRRHSGHDDRGAIDDADLDDLIAFLETLTDRRFVEDRRFALPATACGKKL